MNEVIGKKVKVITTYPGTFDQAHLGHIGTIISQTDENYKVAVDGHFLNWPKEFFEIQRDFESKLVLSLVCEPSSETAVAVQKNIPNDMTAHDNSYDTSFIGLISMKELKETIEKYEEINELENRYVIK